MGRFFLTGDTHRDFLRIKIFAQKNQLTTDDIICILGDAGINYYLDATDIIKKEEISHIPATILCIQGNHEKRASNLDWYQSKIWNGGKVYFEENFPNLLFTEDGEVYNINNKKILVIGGAYSVDKEFRLLRGWQWFEDEQPSDETKLKVENLIKEDNKYDLVLTHTCPYQFMPRHLFLPSIDQSKVDNSTEIWLQKIEEQINYKEWYFGHFHDEYNVNDKVHMLYKEFKEIL